jgi:peptidoglycan/LPS O-acetylase OafA/YrhL
VLWKLFLLEIRTLPRTEYRTDVDGLRAVAVLLVLVFHFSLVPVITAGFLGVDIFFVISGFLITGILRRQLDSGSLRLATFYTNRIRRLAPALLVTLLAVLLVGLVCLFPGELIELGRQIFVSQFYVANIYFWRNVNYFGLGAHSVYLLHMWSLGVEEQFYIIYPLFLILLNRYLKRYFWRSIFFAFIISFGANALCVEWKPWATFYLLPTRSWQLLLGALVIPLAQYWKRPALVDELIALIGATLIVTSVTFYRKDIPIPGYYALLPTVGAACLLLAGTNYMTYIARFLSLRPIVYIGAISYPLYLVHWPIAVLSGLLILERSNRVNIIMFCLSIVLAGIIYHFVEHPIRKKLWISDQSKLFVYYGTGLALTVSFLTLVFATHGLPGRFPPDIVRLAAYAEDKPPPLVECQNADIVESGIEQCRLGVRGKAPTWFVFGDSHAWALHSALDQWLNARGEAALFATRPNCIPLNGVHTFGDEDSCFIFNRSITRIIENSPNLENILLISTWLEANEWLSTSTRVVTSKAESLSLFDRYFSSTIEHLSKLNRKVYIWEPVPGARNDVPRGLARAALSGESNHLEFSLSEYRLKYSFFFQSLENNRTHIYATFSPSQLLCGSGACEVEMDGRPLYVDDAHMSNSTATIWSRVLENPHLENSPSIH